MEKLSRLENKPKEELKAIPRKKLTTTKINWRESWRPSLAQNNQEGSSRKTEDLILIPGRKKDN